MYTKMFDINISHIKQVDWPVLKVAQQSYDYLEVNLEILNCKDKINMVILL